MTGAVGVALGAVTAEVPAHQAPRADAPLTWSLPHHGDALPSCGQLVHFAHALAGNGTWHYRSARSDCARFVCPTCHGWEVREASAISSRIAAWASVASSRATHVVVSPPPSLWPQTASLDGYRSLRSTAYRVAASRGVRGGALVFHPIRLASRRWGGSGCPHEGPHFHVLGDAWLDRSAVRAGHLRDGWVVRGLKVRGSAGSVRRTALYLLSHAGQATLSPEGNPALEGPTQKRPPVETVTWFGSMAYNRLRVAEPPPEGVLCAVCREMVPLREWIPLTWEGSGPPPADSGVADPTLWRARVLDRTCGYGREVELSL